jgi:hypothetical protein
MHTVDLPSPRFWLKIMVLQNPAASNMKFRPSRRIEELPSRHITLCKFCLLLDAQGFHKPGDPQVEPVRTKCLVSYRLPIKDHMPVRLDFCRLIECPKLFLWPTPEASRHAPQLASGLPLTAISDTTPQSLK